MAATRLIPMHISKGKTIARSLGDRTNYAKNPDKTEKGRLVTGYQCDPLTVDEEFLLSKRRYEQITGRRQQHEVIAYQIRQSFKPGEITPEEANRLGRELALRFTKGRYAFIVATHTDRAHIHNHIIYNSTSIDGSRKFKNFFCTSENQRFDLSGERAVRHHPQALPGAHETDGVSASHEKSRCSAAGH